MIFKIWWDLKLGMDRIAGFWNEECLYVHGHAVLEVLLDPSVQILQRYIIKYYVLLSALP